MTHAIRILKENLAGNDRMLSLYEELVEADQHWIDSGINVEYYTKKLGLNSLKAEELRIVCSHLQHAISVLEHANIG